MEKRKENNNLIAWVGVQATEENGNVLIKTWKIAVGSAWIFFIGFILFIGFDTIYSSNPLCPSYGYNFSSIFWHINYSVLGGFVLILMLIIMKILQFRSNGSLAPLYVALNIVTMGTIATFLALIPEWGGYCIDVLNVASPGAIWAEWMVNILIPF